MKKIAFIILVAALFGCKSTVTVVDRSGRKPAWVNSVEQGYIMASGTSSNINTAQENALNMIKERIVNSVAENVRSTSQVTTEEQNIDNRVTKFLETHKTTTSTETGQVPILQGVSLSKAEDYYWEKTRNRDTGVEVYNYHIKYPFSDMDMQKLVIDFNMRDKQMGLKLEEALAKIDNINSIEDIDVIIDELRSLSSYFMDARKNQAEAGISRLQNIFNQINFHVTDNSPGQLAYYLTLNNSSINASTRPNVSSECARVVSIENQDGTTMINYDYRNCFEDEENFLDLTYRLRNGRIDNKFYFDITADKVEIFVNAPIRFQSVEKSEDIISKSKINIPIVSKYDAPFTIQRVVLEFRNHSPVVIDNINESFKGTGNHYLEINSGQNMSVNETSSQGSSINMISGQIFYRSDKTGESYTYRIYNQNYSTDW